MSLLIAGLTLVLAACGGPGPGVQHDEAFDKALDTLFDEGGTKDLRSMVSGDWDTAHVFPMETATEEHVAQQVGRPVDLPGGITAGGGSVLVFTRSGEIVRAVSVNVAFVEGTFPPSTVVSRDEERGGMRLTEPS
ncbi:hypothetical protein JOF53_004270 [Crossiella equi]|uniref:DUF4440 domain-containing protein n=1 Tax=Crossiella equi TaxID=130796 RepID=A0ABS5AFN7_9PSEU|nr:hypothetical protein [Crossiella equi]MBP2475398.1 hypothetical protein [Crossiella equi]